ncbi:energy transducer TonB [Undibacterium arcticum]
MIVLKYFVDADGRLVHTDVVRSNHDRAAESTALASLKSAAPFPKPRSHLLHHGKVEISETWLFNDDGRFQLRSVAQPQINE